MPLGFGLLTVCDVACMCDLRIASEEATFEESFVRVGLIPSDGGAWLLPRAVGMAKAIKMALTGDPISAREALTCGLVSQVVAADTLLAAARALAARIVRKPGNVLRRTKRLIREGQSMSLDSVLQMSAGLRVIAHESPQHLQTIDAFIEKRPAVFSDQ